MLNTIYVMLLSFQADTLPASAVVHLQLQDNRCRKQPGYTPTLSEPSFELSTLINFRDLNRISVPDLFLPDLLTISPTGKSRLSADSYRLRGQLQQHDLLDLSIDFP